MCFINKFISFSVMSGLTLDSINQETHKGKYPPVHGTYLGNIYGIYKECITNISIDIYDMKYKIITHTQAPPSAAPQWGLCF